MTFLNELNRTLTRSQLNFYGKENWDANRFGPYRKQDKKRLNSFSEIIKGIYRRIKGVDSNNFTMIQDHGAKLEEVYNSLDKHDRALFVEIIAYRLLGYKKVKLPVNSSSYWEGISDIGKLQSNNEVITADFMNFQLKRTNLKPLGFDAEIWYTAEGIYTDFCLEQYRFKGNGQPIGPEPGDFVIDAGGCWGDTAIYFGCSVGDEGKVFSFEFIPGNIEVFKKNISVNPQLQQRIDLIEQPLSDVSGQKIYFSDNGPASRVETEPSPDLIGQSSTICIDDFARDNNLPKIDLIKMDIEGMELRALHGAKQTILKHTPKLAISIYHSWEDMHKIHNWIESLGAGYKFHLGHYTIHKEETILFASCN